MQENLYPVLFVSRNLKSEIGSFTFRDVHYQIFYIPLFVFAQNIIERPMFYLLNDYHL